VETNNNTIKVDFNKLSNKFEECTFNDGTMVTTLIKDSFCNKEELFINMNKANNTDINDDNYNYPIKKGM